MEIPKEGDIVVTNRPFSLFRKVRRPARRARQTVSDHREQQLGGKPGSAISPLCQDYQRAGSAMPINNDKPHLWKADIVASVDLYNEWFMKFAPLAFRTARKSTVQIVEVALIATGDLLELSPGALAANPGSLQALRMCTCPPIARDRLVGLADASKNLVKSMEEKAKLPPKLLEKDLAASLDRIADKLGRLLDPDLFPWLEAGEKPAAKERERAATIVADRLCGALSDPIIRNEQERRQLAKIKAFLEARGYMEQPHPSGKPLTEMSAGTFSFRLNVLAGTKSRISLPMDAVVQPHRLRPSRVPILIEAKSAGDFTNTNKRRKEEAKKMSDLKKAYGKGANLVLFLCGYFDSGYLGYEAAEGIDWIWEHRIDDMDQLLQ